MLLVHILKVLDIKYLFLAYVINRIFHLLNPSKKNFIFDERVSDGVIGQAFKPTYQRKSFDSHGLENFGPT